MIRILIAAVAMVAKLAITVTPGYTYTNSNGHTVIVSDITVVTFNR